MTRWLVAAAGYLILALACSAPLLTKFSAAYPHDQGDPLLNTWLLWWSTQQLPLSAVWWSAPMFHPAANVMALSEVLIGLMPIFGPAQWVSGSPIVAYNMTFLLSFPLCAMAMAFLAHEVTGHWDASLLSGLAFAFAPYRMGQLSHIQMLAYYGAPLALAALHAYLRTEHRRWLALFGASWLLQALSNGYALFHVAVLIAIWIAWFVRSRRTLLEIGAAWLLATLPLAPLLLKYRQVHSEWHLTRDINEIRRFSVDLVDFISAPPEVMAWGARLWTARPENAVFPGLTVLLVMLIWGGVEWRASRRAAARPAPSRLQQLLIGISLVAGLIALSALTLGPWRLGPLSVSGIHKPFSIAVYARILAWLSGTAVRHAWSKRSTVTFYVIGLGTMYLLALGPEPRLLGRPILYEPPYAWLMRLPGFATLRVPGRFAMLGVLCQAALLALAVARLNIGARQRVVAAVIAVGVVADGWPRVVAAGAPLSGPTVAREASAVVELPMDAPETVFAALQHQMTHGRPVLNGYSGYNPPHYLPLVDAAKAQPPVVLADIEPDGWVQVSIDRGRGDSPQLAAQVALLPGVQPLPLEERWLRYLVPQHRRLRSVQGPRLSIAAVSAIAWGTEAPRTLDGNIDTGWHSGNDQIGNEVFDIDLGSPRLVGALVVNMGAYSFGYPRELVVEGDDENGAFAEIWRGPLARETLQAALAHPSVVPMTIAFPPRLTRHLRLRQLGSAAGIPWWIPELAVHAPTAAQ